MTGYDTFRSEHAVRKAYQRARSPKHFIIEDGARWAPKCACGLPINVFPDDHGPGYRGNRCTYYPSTKRIVARHYVCAWTGTLNAVNKLHERIRHG